MFEVPSIRDKLARDAVGETLPTGEADIRVYVGSGVLVRHVAVYEALLPNDIVEAFWVSMDTI